MPKQVEMIVSLKMPDTTALTALQTLQKIGFNKIKGISRADYYNFSIEGDIEKFKSRICKVDILVNANKHAYNFSITKDNKIKIIVKDLNGDGSRLLSTLKNRLGLEEIKKIEKATLWSMAIDADEKEARKIAESAARELLVNENYQEFVIL